ncbi:WbqC family protein [Sphingobacterium deserti]|uniref:WbqC-like family protein n=1 Tax=Sphingobacterium deserti TaxID=1229276 RepID=A0A0B8T744_9SPHI|nr:WbqC family protein [Sphingobacterium deserti]KGE14144.1 hypothetical protein DI53_1974 [Sphingobacterium deserti]
MKVGIMQPYFLPYIGYISLIKHTERFILFDVVQFIRHGWIERNRVLKQNDGWLYIQVPLEKFSRETLIKDVRINNEINWKDKIFAQLITYKKRAPFYATVVELLRNVFDKSFDSIVDLNRELLIAICQYLEIAATIEVFSQMNLQIDEAHAPDEWALNICKKLGTDISYINPIGGMDFFDRKKYEDNDINLLFQKMMITPYSQKRATFEPGLSIIDVMMFNSKDEINLMLDNYELI